MNNATLVKLRNVRLATIDDAKFYLQVASDNGYEFSEDGRGEIRYTMKRLVRAQKSVRRINAAIQRRNDHKRVGQPLSPRVDELLYNDTLDPLSPNFDIHSWTGRDRIED